MKMFSLIIVNLSLTLSGIRIATDFGILQAEIANHCAMATLIKKKNY